MKNRQELEHEAKEVFEQHFKERDEKKDNIDNEKEVVLNKEHLTQEINEMKMKEEKKRESLEILKDKIDQEAKDEYEKTFHDQKPHYQHIDNEKEIVLDKESLMKEMNELKNKE